MKYCLVTTVSDSNRDLIFCKLLDISSIVELIVDDESNGNNSIYYKLYIYIPNENDILFPAPKPVLMIVVSLLKK